MRPPILNALADLPKANLMDVPKVADLLLDLLKLAKVEGK